VKILHIHVRIPTNDKAYGEETVIKN